MLWFQEHLGGALSMGTHPTALTEPALPMARTLSTGDSTMP